MIYFGRKASNILNQNLNYNANIKVKGYYKDENCWIAFDNYTGNCWVEEFNKEKYAIGWLNDSFEISELKEVQIIKFNKNFYLINGKTFIKVQKNKGNEIKLINIFVFGFSISIDNSL